MVEESESGVGRAGAETAAIGLAINAAAGDPSVAADAREYLKKQSRIADLQIDTLQKKDEFELSHLRFRRFSDYAKFSLEVAGFLVVLLVIGGLVTMVWSAANDHDLIFDAFSVPPDLAQSGMTGSVIAGRVLDRFGEMDSSPLTFTEDVSAFHINNQEAARVEIPETGISIGELNRYLHAWLGRAVHVTGDLVHSGKGLSLTVRFGSQPGSTAYGTPDQLDALIQKSAENVFRAASPLRFADWLSSRGRFPEAQAIAEGESHLGTPEHRSMAYLSLAVIGFFRSDASKWRRDSELAIQLDPNNPVAWYTLQSAVNIAGHEEEQWRIDKTALSVSKSGRPRNSGMEALHNLPGTFEADLEGLAGDWKAAADTCRGLAGRAFGICGGDGRIAIDAALYDIARARNLVSLHPEQLANGEPDFDLICDRAQIEATAGRWAEALAWSKKGEAAAANDPAADRDSCLRPYEAVALAELGRVAEAKSLIGKTPLDCDPCVRARGKVDGLAREWSAAAHWFAIVASRSPDIPFAYTDWGAMLLHEGDYEGAIAKFETAYAKGPHFADPLEMWGEALMQQNRSDLALAKFEETNRYAPSWGRLHLKWGEALYYAGKRDDAGNAFAVASHLDLSAQDENALHGWVKRHD